MRFLLLGMIAAGVLAAHDVGAVTPLNNNDEFLMGAFRMPTTPPKEGAVPARLAAHDAAALPKGTWLRFEICGADRYKGWSAQMQIDDDGGITLVTHFGDAKPETKAQQLDAKTLADLRAEVGKLASGPAYRAHEGLAYAPTFYLRVAGDKGDKQLVFEAFENDAIAHLRRIASFANSTPLKAKKPK